MPLVTESNPAQYDNFTFPVSTETVQFDQEPVTDEADRVVLYVRYRIGLQFSIITPAGNDATIAALRSTLMQRNKVFVYANRGFGADFTIGPGNIEDVKGGPKPVAFSWKTKGGNRGCTINWTIEVCIPSNCSSSSAPYGVLMSLNYKQNVRIDRHGMTTRTHTGHVVIPKIGGFEQAFSADDWLESAIPPVPVKFRRTDRTYDYSFDKSRCDFNVVDEELTEFALPPGCTDASASHEVQTDEDRGWTTWNGSISGRFQMAQGLGINSAWAVFKELIKTRLDFIKLNIDTGVIGPQVQDEQKPTQRPKVALTAIRFSEPDIFKSNTYAFSIDYRQICKLEAMLGGGTVNAGMYVFPRSGIEAWNTWINSIDNSVHPRGLARLQLDLNAEMLIDLCASESVQTPSNVAEFTGDGPEFDAGDITDLQPDPDPETSWFLYESELEVYEDRYGVVSAALNDGGWQGYNTSPGDLDAQGYMPDEKPSEETDEVQFRAPPTLIIYLAGQAMRAWFPIPRPKIVSYNGNAVKEVSTQADGCFWRQKNVGSLGIGMPIYFAEWRLKYVITGRPTEPIRPPVNLAEQV